jgi:hypothetical protein
MVGSIGVLDGGGGPPGQVLDKGEVGLGVAAGLVAGQGDGAEDVGPARQRHDQYRPEVQGGEQLQMVGVLRDGANDVQGELLEQQRLVGVGGRAGAGEVDRAAVGQPGQRGGVVRVAVGEGVMADGAVGSIQADLAPVAQARTAGSHAASGIVDEELICRLVGLVRA